MEQIGITPIERLRLLNIPLGESGGTFARAYTTIAQLIPHNAYTKVNLGQKSYDAGGNFNTSLNRFTFPMSGYYHIMGQSSWEKTGDVNIGIRDKAYFQTRIRRNGDSVNIFLVSREASPSLGTSEDKLRINAVVNDIRHCNAGDYIEMFVWQKNDVSWSCWLKTTGTPGENGGPDINNFMTVWVVKPD